MNVNPEHDVQSIIKEYAERNTVTPHIESWVDDQLIVFIPFTTSVKLKAILLGTDSGDLRPSAVKIYSNQPHCPDFEQLDGTACLQDMSLEATSNESSGDLVKEYPMRVARFTNVFSIVLFFPSSFGGQNTRIYYIGFKGEVLTPNKERSDRVSLTANYILSNTPLDANCSFKSW